MELGFLQHIAVNLEETLAKLCAWETFRGLWGGTLGKSLELVVDTDDVDEIMEDYTEELTTEDLVQLQIEHMRDTEQAIYSSSRKEKKREEVSSVKVQEMCGMLGRLHMLIENITLTKSEQ